MPSSGRSAFFSVVLGLGVALGGCTSLLGDYTVSDSVGVDGSTPDGGSGDVTVPPDTGRDTGTTDDAPITDDASDASDAPGCGANQILCNGSCVTLDAKNCGTCGHDCTRLPHVSGTGVTCTSSGRCVVPPSACAPGFAHCSANPDDGCEADLSQPAHCGTCSTTCSGGSPVCSGSAGDGGAGFACSSGCPSATPTLCSGSCVDLTSNAQHCASCPNACPTIANGQPACANSICGFTCNSAFHKCGSACADNNSVNSCGASCTACQPPANGTATCNGTSCGFTCNSGFHACGNACVDNNSINSCGASCTACQPPANGTSTCNGTSCGFTCNAGTHVCGNACADNTSVNSCGTVSCSACQPPANSSATCNGTSCGFTCAGGFAACGNACVNLSVDPNNCGACATICPAPRTVCTAAACACPGGAPNYCSGSNTCVDFQTDANNCGSCGHGCLGGTCAGGMCQPVTLASNLGGNSRGIATTQGAIFFGYGGTSSTLGKCSVSGCPNNTPQVLASGFNGLTTVFIDQATAFLFAAESNASVFHKVDPNNGSFLFNFSSQSNAEGVAADNSYVYWGATSAISRASKYDGSGLLQIASGLNFVVALSYDPGTTALFIADYSASKIIKCTTTGSGCGAAWTSIAGSPAPTGITTGAGRVFWTAQGTSANSYADGGTFSCSTAGGSVTALGTGAAFGFAHSITSDATYVYFHGGNNIYRCPLTGCTGAPTTLSSSLGDARNMTNDAAAVYWTVDSGTVYKVAK